MKNFQILTYLLFKRKEVSFTMSEKQEDFQGLTAVVKMVTRTKLGTETL